MRKRNKYNKEIYTTWRTKINPETEDKVVNQRKPKKTLFRAVLIAIGSALLISIVSQLIAMSQFSTLGYEIEILQQRKAELIENNSKIRTAIAQYQTTEYYNGQAAQMVMQKPEKITYIHIAGQDIAEATSEWQTPQNQ